MPKKLEHYVCFSCRKQFKKVPTRHPICPECGKKMTWMGRNFRAPKKKDSKAWRVVEQERKKGRTHDTCPCCLKDKQKKKTYLDIKKLLKKIFK